MNEALGYALVTIGLGLMFYVGYRVGSKSALCWRCRETIKRRIR